jgi:hypothetical protein
MSTTLIAYQEESNGDKGEFVQVHAARRIRRFSTVWHLGPPEPRPQALERSAIKPTILGNPRERVTSRQFGRLMTGLTAITNDELMGFGGGPLRRELLSHCVAYLRSHQHWVSPFVSAAITTAA